MIPKIIHYCWFGGKELPDSACSCIKSWEKYCPGYEILRWDESNIDIFENDYIKEAYEEKKWAFVSDYARLKALTQYGGIYLDTDVELIRSMDSLLDQEAFCGFEAIDSIGTSTMGFSKGNRVLSDFIKSYQENHFRRKDGSLNQVANTKRLTDILVANGLEKCNTTQKLDNITVYNTSYFSPKDIKTGELHITNETYAIHYYDGSWLGEEELFYGSLKNNLAKIFPMKMSSYVAKLISVIKYRGLKASISQIIGWLNRR